MKLKKKAKKRKPTDSTVRNVRAANKRFEQMAQRLNALTLDIMSVDSRLNYLENIQRLKRAK